jgi:hypothetical protein
MEETVQSFRPSAAHRALKIPSAMGLLQTFPVQRKMMWCCLTVLSVTLPVIAGASFNFEKADYKYIILRFLNELVLSTFAGNEGNHMSLSNEEKALVEEALQVYLQLVARQMKPAQVQGLAVMAQGIVQKLDSVGGGAMKGGRPAGISEEWFKKVCQRCDKLTPSGCSDKVTAKYPGKCDPIIKFENEKHGIGKAPQKDF